MTGTDIIEIIRKTNRRLSKLLLTFLILIPILFFLFKYERLQCSMTEALIMGVLIILMSFLPFAMESYSSNELWNASCCLYCLEIILLILTFILPVDLPLLYFVMPVVSLIYLNQSILQKMIAVGFGGMAVVRIINLVSAMTWSQSEEAAVTAMYYDLFKIAAQYIVFYFVVAQVFSSILKQFNDTMDNFKATAFLEEKKQQPQRYGEKESAEKFILDGEAYDVCQLFNSLNADMQKLIEGKKKAFILDLDKNLPIMLLGRKAQLKSALSNICSDLLMYQSNAAVSVYVTYDTGINPKKKHNITLIIHIDSNVALNKKSADKTVLGYYLSQNIINDLHGTFSEQSEGNQMSFRICVLQRVENEMTIEQRQNLQVSELNELRQRAIAAKGVDSIFHSNVNILVVDDNKEIRKLLDSVITSMGINVTCINNGMDCIELIKSKDYHMLIIDQMMPDKSGMETVKEIRFMDDVYFRKLPIVMMSVQDYGEDNSAYKLEGFTDCISKPIKTGEVKACILNWIKVERLMSYEEYMRLQKNGEA